MNLPSQHTQLALNASPDQVTTTPAADPEKPSLPSPDAKELQERTRDLADSEATGVKKAEAAALVWSKPALWGIYAWYRRVKLSMWRYLKEMG